MYQSPPQKSTKSSIVFHGELNTEKITIDNQELWKNVEFTRPDTKTLHSIKKQAKQLQKLPIFVIVSHGEYSLPVKVKTNKNKSILQKDRSVKNTRWLSERFATSNFCKKVPHNTFVASNNISGTNSLVSDREDKYLKQILKDPDYFKKQLLQNHENLWCKSCETNKIMKPDYFSPGSYYPDKMLFFYDNPDDKRLNHHDKESAYWDWYMGILPIIDKKFNKMIPNLSHMEEHFPLTDDYNMTERIFNDTTDFNWTGRSQLKKRYNEVTRLIHESLPKVKEGEIVDCVDKKQYGKGILLSDIMEILGPGIYITLNCSPFTNTSHKEISTSLYDRLHITKLKQLQIKEQLIFQSGMIRIVNQLAKYSNYLSKTWISKLFGSLF